MYVNLDPTFGLGSEESAAELIKFIEDNKAEAYDDTENKFYRDNQVKIQDKKEIKSAVIALNDDFEKGETIFPIFGDVVKPKKGRLLIFPPHWTYLHAGLPATKPGYAKYFLGTYLQYL